MVGKYLTLFQNNTCSKRRLQNIKLRSFANLYSQKFSDTAVILAIAVSKRLKPRANGRYIVGYYMLRPFAHSVACCDVVACCCAKFETGQTFQPTTPNIFLFHDRRSVAQQCWIRLHSSSNIVGAAHAHYAWFTKTYGLYPSHDALQVATLLGVVASVCTPLPTHTQHIPTLLA